ncbi:MAG: hypothetical protein Q7U85_03690, partial [Rhodocyclaceae bacterium]|nr:hypothetical protein [Rhodocyclaceae bacterium]
ASGEVEMNRRVCRPEYQRGTTMIEALVTIVIMALGLLGLAGLQARLQVVEIESYQRAQALLLLNDMSSRLSTNRRNAASYVTGNTWGAGMTCPAATSGSAQHTKDLIEWCNALQGASETKGGGAVGAMVGGRGCVQDLGAGQYLVTIAWQGLAPVSAPPVGVNCGNGLYDGGACTGDLCRRVVTTVVQIAPLI